MSNPYITWSDSIYEWSASSLNWDGSFNGPMPVFSSNNVLYQSINQPFLIFAPQLVRWRHRYRGPRESYKVNLEMQQFLYDTRKLYEGIDMNSNNFITDSYGIEFGVNLDTYFWSSYYPTQIYDNSSSTYDSAEYDGPIFVSVPSIDLVALDITGSNDIIMRLNRLLKRVEALEFNR